MSFSVINDFVYYGLVNFKIHQAKLLTTHKTYCAGYRFYARLFLYRYCTSIHQTMANKNFLLSCARWCDGIVIVLKCWLLCMIVLAPLKSFKQVKKYCASTNIESVVSLVLTASNIFCLRLVFDNLHGYQWLLCSLFFGIQTNQ